MTNLKQIFKWMFYPLLIWAIVMTLTSSGIITIYKELFLENP